MALNFINLFFCIPFSYGSLKLMIVVKINRAITVLRPFEANFSHGVLTKFESFLQRFVARLKQILYF